MPSASLIVESIPTFRDLRERFAKATKDLLESKRELLRGEGRRYVRIAGDEAPGGPGRTVARGITFKTFIQGEAVGFRAFAGRIGRFHDEGTGIYGPMRRLIRPVTARALRFEIGGEVLFRMWVRGIKPNRFMGRAYRKWIPGARKMLRQIALRYVSTLRGVKRVSVLPYK